MNSFKHLTSMLLFLYGVFSLSSTYAHESLLYDLQHSYQAEVRWGDIIEIENTESVESDGLRPKLSLVIMLESENFDKANATKEASRYLREFSSNYQEVFFVFSDLAVLKFMPPKRYGMVLTVQEDSDQEDSEKRTITTLTDEDIDYAVKQLRSSEKLRESSESDEAHLHSEEEE